MALKESACDAGKGVAAMWSQNSKAILLERNSLNNTFPHLQLLDSCGLANANWQFEAAVNNVSERKFLSRVETHEFAPREGIYGECMQITKHFGYSIPPNGEMYFWRRETEEEAQKYFSLLTDCRAMEQIRSLDCNFDEVPTLLIPPSFLEHVWKQQYLKKLWQFDTIFDVMAAIGALANMCSIKDLVPTKQEISDIIEKVTGFDRASHEHNYIVKGYRQEIIGHPRFVPPSEHDLAISTSVSKEISSLSLVDERMTRKENATLCQLDAANEIESNIFQENFSLLNDKSLKKIFSHLSMPDLFVVKNSNSSRRFIQMADEVFIENYLRSDGTYEITGETKNYDKSVQAMKYFGNVIPSVLIRFKQCKTSAEVHKYFSLLNYCSALENLWIWDCDFNLILIDLIEVNCFKNLECLIFLNCSGFEGNIKMLMNACNPLKISHLEMDVISCKQISDELLAFIAERWVNIEFLNINLPKCSPTFHENVSKLQNLKKLWSFNITCGEISQISSVINALANIDSLHRLDCTVTSDLIAENINDVAEAINNLSSVECVTFHTEREVPEMVEKVTKFKQTNYERCKLLGKHKYEFERDSTQKLPTHFLKGSKEDLTISLAAEKVAPEEIASVCLRNATNKIQTNDSRKKIISLNDNSLKETFSQKSLNSVFKEKPMASDGFYELPGEDCNFIESAQVTEHFGDVMSSVAMYSYRCKTRKQTRKYFSLLNNCSAMKKLVISGLNFNDLSTRPLENEVFKNLNWLAFNGCSGSNANIKRFLKACDPLKITSLYFHASFGTKISGDLLAFIAEQLINITHLTIELPKCTQSLLENLSKLQNLKKLLSLDITCKKMVQIPSVLNAVAKIELQRLSCTVTSDKIPNEMLDIVEAINNLSNIWYFRLSTKREIPAIVESLTNFTLMDHEYRENSMENVYEFENNSPPKLHSDFVDVCIENSATKPSTSCWNTLKSHLSKVFHRF